MELSPQEHGVSQHMQEYRSRIAKLVAFIEGQTNPAPQSTVEQSASEQVVSGTEIAA